MGWRSEECSLDGVKEACVFKTPSWCMQSSKAHPHSGLGGKERHSDSIIKTNQRQIGTRDATDCLRFTLEWNSDHLCGVFIILPHLCHHSSGAGFQLFSLKYRSIQMVYFCHKQKKKLSLMFNILLTFSGPPPASWQKKRWETPHFSILFSERSGYF